MSAATDLRTLFARRNFALYTLGNASGLLAQWMFKTTIAWLAWELTHKSVWVGLAVTAEMIPTVLVGLYAGVVADRADLRAILMRVQFSTVCIYSALAFLAMQGALSIPLLLSLMAVNGVVVGFAQPAGQAAITGLVDNAELGTAISLNSILFNLARFAGPALAGGLIAAFGGAVALVATACFAGLFFLMLMVVRFNVLPRLSGDGSIWLKIAEGMRQIFVEPTVAFVFMLYATAAFLIRPISELLPELADRVLDGGAETLALLSSAMGLGAIIAGFANMIGGARMQVPLAVWGTLLAVLGALVLALTENVTVALIGAVLFGGALAAGGVASQTVLQLGSPAHLRGRVMSLHGIIFRVGPALGAVTLGGLGDTLDLQQSLLIGIAAMLIVWVLLMKRRGAAHG
ncbi:MFS transporter [Martelella lutilitoris]|uniref:MFS transporter n=1 Tax=Martelella lutilitoris TaxID=2583532 RepID=A0A7T7HH48_9HYPH|nr:MFS transporter [Martelella lutilitoris]QQM29094.1 MFS transporter [Martelella lutilitoris]